MANIIYIYVLFRPWNGQPCYVGKGRGRRWDDHQKYGENHKNRHLAFIFRKANRLGLEVPKVKVREHLNNIEANEIEIALIRAIGRRDKKEGPLANHTDGADGIINVSENCRAKLRGSAKRQWADPIQRTKMIASLKVVRDAPDYKNNASKRQKALWDNPDYRASAIAKRLTPQAQAKNSLIAKNLWKDPNFRENISDALKAAWADPERREKRLAAHKMLMESPEYRSKMSERIKMAWKNPDFRASHLGHK